MCEQIGMKAYLGTQKQGTQADQRFGGGVTLTLGGRPIVEIIANQEGYLGKGIMARFIGNLTSPRSFNIIRLKAAANEGT